MTRRELYARIEPKYLTTCNMTVKTAVIIFVCIEVLLVIAACVGCFWFAYFNLGALCVAIVVWLIFILFGAIIGFQWVLIPFGVVHCIAVLALTIALFSVISITICPYLHERWIDYLEDLSAEHSYWFTRNQLYHFSRISFGICMGVFILLISIMVTLIKTGYMAYHYLGHYVDKDSPNFEKFLERAVQEAYKKGKSKSTKSEDEVASADKEEPSFMPSEMMLISIASESTVNTPSPKSRVFTQPTESEFST